MKKSNFIILIIAIIIICIIVSIIINLKSNKNGIYLYYDKDGRQYFIVIKNNKIVNYNGKEYELKEENGKYYFENQEIKKEIPINSVGDDSLIDVEIKYKYVIEFVDNGLIFQGYTKYEINDEEYATFNEYNKKYYEDKREFKENGSAKLFEKTNGKQNLNKE